MVDLFLRKMIDLPPVWLALCNPIYLADALIVAGCALRRHAWP